MDLLLILLAVFTVIFFLLASTNGIKKYTDYPFVKKIASKHKIFGMLANLSAISYLIIVIIIDQLQFTELLVVISLFLTGLFGILFYKLKIKALYVVHRIIGPITFILMIIHVIFMSRI